MIIYMVNFCFTRIFINH